MARRSRWLVWTWRFDRENCWLSNLVFLPMLWLSGLFIPLPKFLERWAVIWPAFHLNQAALGWAGVSEFSFLAPGISAAVLVGITVIFGGLAIRRLARQG